MKEVSKCATIGRHMSCITKSYTPHITSCICASRDGMGGEFQKSVKTADRGQKICTALDFFPTLINAPHRRVTDNGGCYAARDISIKLLGERVGMPQPARNMYKSVCIACDGWNCSGQSRTIIITISKIIIIDSQGPIHSQRTLVVTIDDKRSLDPNDSTKSSKCPFRGNAQLRHLYVGLWLGYF